jgi:hypothetical protein
MGDRGERREALEASIEALRKDLSAPGWRQVLACLRRQPFLPAGTFEVLRHLVNEPRAVVLALLLQADEIEMGRVWTTLERLPFDWHLVPIEAWRQALEVYREHLEKTLVLVPEGADLAREMVSSRLDMLSRQRNFMDCIVRWLRIDQGIAGAEPEPRTSRSLEVQLADARQALFHRTLGRWWPEEGGLAELDGARLPGVFEGCLRFIAESPAFKHSVLKAPMLAAAAALLGQPMSARFLFTIRRLRDFDDQFFEEAYEVYLHIALASHFSHRETQP